MLRKVALALALAGCALAQFTPPAGGWTRPEGGFTRPEGGFTRPEGGFTRPEGGFSFTTPEGGFTRPAGDFLCSEIIYVFYVFLQLHSLIYGFGQAIMTTATITAAEMTTQVMKTQR